MRNLIVYSFLADKGSMLFFCGTAAAFRCTCTNSKIRISKPKLPSDFCNATFDSDVIWSTLLEFWGGSLPHPILQVMLGPRCHGRPWVQLRVAGNDPGTARAAGTTARSRGCAEVPIYVLKSQFGRNKTCFQSNPSFKITICDFCAQFHDVLNDNR